MRPKRLLNHLLLLIANFALGANAPDQPPARIEPPVKVATATKDAPFVNGLGMLFVPVPIAAGPTRGQRLLFSVWDTRVQDYAVFVKETERDWPEVDFAQGPTHPAVNVSWEDAHAFCAWLTQREVAAGRIGAHDRFRLPTDYEWSCAVGIGRLEKVPGTPASKSGKVKNVYPWGMHWPPPKGAGNYLPSVAVDDFEKTSPVGSFPANECGLYDMGGNVWQWCEDPWKKDDFRVLRGASWFNFDAPSLLSSARINRDKTERYDENCGFRCVLAEEVPAPATGNPASPSPGKKR